HRLPGCDGTEEGRDDELLPEVAEAQETRLTDTGDDEQHEDQPERDQRRPVASHPRFVIGPQSPQGVIHGCFASWLGRRHGYTLSRRLRARRIPIAPRPTAARRTRPCSSCW